MPNTPEVIDAVVVPDANTAITFKGIPLVPDTPATTTRTLTLAQQQEMEVEVRDAEKKGKELTPDQHRWLLYLSEKEGLTQQQIADRMGCAQTTVSRILRKYGTTADLAKRRAENLALEAVEKIVATGKAKDLIKFVQGVRTSDGQRVLESDKPVASDGGGSPAVFIGVKVDVK